MIINEIRKELRKHVDQKYHDKIKVFFKEGIKLYGIKTPIVKKISLKYFSSIKMKSKQEIFSLCEKLLKSGYSEERTIAFDWAFRLKNRYEKKDFKIFETWLKKYIFNWGACDDLCVHVFGCFIFQFPKFIPRIKIWVVSKNRWLRRASAVVLIYSIRRKKLLSSIFELADILLFDKDDMVQKGYGWMLKEASNHYPKKVFDYVMKHKHEMPRTSLRYAIEKLPTAMKKQAMKKG